VHFLLQKFTIASPPGDFFTFFWYCNTTAKLLTCFSAHIGVGLLTKEKFFYALDRDKNVNKVELFLYDMFKFRLWSFKLRKKLPNWSYFKNEFTHNVGVCAGANNSLKQKLQSFLLRRDE
jgi:hypothetical protein